MRGSRFMTRGHLKITGLLVLLLGASACEIFHGYVREVPVTATPPESCVRTSLSEVPGITVYAQGRSDTGFWFIWSADQMAEGTVSIDRSDNKALLRLSNGLLNACFPDGLARGRVVMNSLYERLRINCGALPEPSTVKEERIRACD